MKFKIANTFQYLKVCILIAMITVSCKQKDKPLLLIAPKYNYTTPLYKSIRLLPQQDTLHFLLDSNTYNRIKNVNLFTHNGRQFILFYDKGSKSVNIYDFNTQTPIKRVLLKKWITETKLDKASVYIKSIDSIYVATLLSYYQLDSAGSIKLKVDFDDRNMVRGMLRTVAPPVINDNVVYIPNAPTSKETSLEAQKGSRLLCELNLQSKSWSLKYGFPRLYETNLYGYSFLDFSYCVNDLGHFVFSFPADSNIYETNLKDYHQAYYAKSRFHEGRISPASKDELGKNSYKAYALRNSYGSIIYDPFKKRYLRLAKQKISEADFQKKDWDKKRSIIVMDSTFRIISEFEIKNEYAFETILFTPDGRMYARTNSSDEHAIHYVRLFYEENIPIAKNDLLKK